MSQQPSAARIKDTRHVKAFLDDKLPRDQALRAYPQLKSAFEAQDKLVDAMARHQPLTRDTQRDVGKLIRDTVAKDLLSGREPQATPKLQNAVAVQVAVRNLNTVEAAQADNPARAPALPKENRVTLIRHAEAAMTLDPPGAIRRAGAYASPERFEAYTVAHGLAKLDYPKERSPFRNPELAKVYRSEHAFQTYLREHGAERGAQPTPTRDGGRLDLNQPVVGRGLER